MPERSAEILVVGIGAHRLAGAGLLQEPEDQGDGDQHDDDGDDLRGADREAFGEAGQFLELGGADHEAGAVLEALLVGADHEAGQRVVDEHHPDAGDHEDHRRAALRAVEPIHPAVGQEAKDDRDEDAGGQREECRGQDAEGDAEALEPPGGEDHAHGADRHQVAVGEVGEAQHRVDQRRAEGAEGELRAVGDRGDQDEVGEEDEGVEEVRHRLWVLLGAGSFCARGLCGKRRASSACRSVPARDREERAGAAHSRLGRVACGTCFSPRGRCGGRPGRRGAPRRCRCSGCGPGRGHSRGRRC